MSIADKIIGVMCSCRLVAKDANNPTQGYKYTSAANLFAKINAELTARNLFTQADLKLVDLREVTVFEAAEWFLHKKSFTHKQLQKLCYYAQAWHLALLNRPLFDEEFQAWIHGPVCPTLYAHYVDYRWIVADFRCRPSACQPNRLCSSLNPTSSSCPREDACIRGR